MKKLLYVIAATLSLVACESNTPDGGSTTKGDYVDLGLTSGTKWKVQNEINVNDEHGLFTFQDAIAKFGYELPTKAQCQELCDECSWEWTFGGYKVIGPNKNYIILPPNGHSHFGTDYQNKNGEDGYYWSCSPDGENGAWSLTFDSGSYETSWDLQSSANSIRLVK